MRYATVVKIERKTLIGTNYIALCSVGKSETIWTLVFLIKWKVLFFIEGLSAGTSPLKIGEKKIN
jgi:hypothetical protein